MMVSPGQTVALNHAQHRAVTYKFSVTIHTLRRHFRDSDSARTPDGLGLNPACFK